MEFQTRSEVYGLRFFDTPKEAFEHAREDKSVWKISFGGVRLVKREHDTWVYEPMSSYNEDTIFKIGQY